jgi:hypothetical protein
MTLRRILALPLALVMTTQLAAAGESAVIKTDWQGFQQATKVRKFKDRTVRITLTAGGEVKTALIRVEPNGIVVQVNKSTRQWASASGKEEALVPREAVASVRMGGRVGKGGLIGALAGLGAGAAIAGGVFATDNNFCEAGGCYRGILAIPLTTFVGWLIGHFLSPPAPTFVIER